MLHVGFDVDGVLADLDAAAARLMKAKVGCQVENLGDIKRLGLEADFWKLADETRFHRDYLEPMPGALEAVNKVRSYGDRVWAVTSPPRSVRGWDYDRREWLQAHFACLREDVVSSPDKSMWGGDVLVDDYPKNLRKWRAGAGRGGLALLLSQPWNEDTHDDPRLEEHKVVICKSMDCVHREIAARWVR